MITRFYLSPHSPSTLEVVRTRFGSLISPYVPLGHQSGSAYGCSFVTYGHPEGSAAGDITIIWSVDCAHAFLSFIYFLLQSPSYGVPSFLGFGNLSLSLPLCEWLTSTPFLLLVYYIYIYIYIVFEQNYLQHKVRPNKLKGDSAGFLDRFMRGESLGNGLDNILLINLYIYIYIYNLADLYF